MSSNGLPVFRTGTTRAVFHEGGDITSVKYEVEEFQKEFCIGGVKVGEHGV